MANSHPISNAVLRAIIRETTLDESDNQKSLNNRLSNVYWLLKNAVIDAIPFVDDKMNYPAFAWPGGHQMFYITWDNGVLCPPCVNKNKDLCEQESGTIENNQWAIKHAEINYEDHSLMCDNCNELIPAAYGEADD